MDNTLGLPIILSGNKVKRKIEVEKRFCDESNCANECNSECRKCKKDVCAKHAKIYDFEMTFVLCSNCDNMLLDIIKPHKDTIDTLQNLITALRNRIKSTNFAFAKLIGEYLYTKEVSEKAAKAITASDIGANAQKTTVNRL